MIKILLVAVATAGICGLTVVYAAIFSPPFTTPPGRCEDPWSMYFILIKSNPTAGHELTWDALQQIRTLCKSFGPNAIHHIRCGKDAIGALKCFTVP